MLCFKCNQRPIEFSLSIERRTCDAVAPAMLPTSFCSRRGVHRTSGVAVVLIAEEEPLTLSLLGVPAVRNAAIVFPSPEASAADFESTEFVLVTAVGAEPDASVLRRLALSSTPRTRDAKLREHIDSATSAVSGDACSKRGRDQGGGYCQEA
jgi:hypothetical protein